MSKVQLYHGTSSDMTNLPEGGLYFNTSSKLIYFKQGGNTHSFNCNNNTYTVNNSKITLSASTGLSGGGDFTVNQSSAETISFSLAASGVTAGTYGSSNDSSILTVPEIAVDTYGRITSATNKNYTFHPMTGATASAAGTSGLVPAPAAGKQSQYLRGDGTWATPTNTTYSAAKYNTLGLLKPAYTSTGTATLTTAAASNTISPTIQTKSTVLDRYYAVEADKNGVAYVNVPWDTNWRNFSTSDSTYTDGGDGCGKVMYINDNGKFTHESSLSVSTLKNLFGSSADQSTRALSDICFFSNFYINQTQVSKDTNVDNGMGQNIWVYLDEHLKFKTAPGNSPVPYINTNGKLVASSYTVSNLEYLNQLGQSSSTPLIYLEEDGTLRQSNYSVTDIPNWSSNSTCINTSVQNYPVKFKTASSWTSQSHGVITFNPYHMTIGVTADNLYGAGNSTGASYIPCSIAPLSGGLELYRCTAKISMTSAQLSSWIGNASYGVYTSSANTSTPAGTYSYSNISWTNSTPLIFEIEVVTPLINCNKNKTSDTAIYSFFEDVCQLPNGYQICINASTIDLKITGGSYARTWTQSNKSHFAKLYLTKSDTGFNATLEVGNEYDSTNNKSYARLFLNSKTIAKDSLSSYFSIGYGTVTKLDRPWRSI